MTHYQAPQRDMQFVMNELLGMPAHYASLPGCEDLNAELISAIRAEGAKFTSQVLAPLNQTGDQQGCKFNDGVVTTPDGFKESYEQYCEGGWPGLTVESEFGGQGLPISMGAMMNEMLMSANISWSFLSLGTSGAIDTLKSWGTAEQKTTYLPKMVEGRWSGTMCLTEPHCGTDLGMLRTKAEAHADGSYRLSGTKIFITGGEQDMSQNIVHIVLARLPDAPAGVKGISLFIVPKFMPGALDQRNAVTCGSIEHKMGLKASPTCVMNFDGATGYLLGAPNKGLNCMFTFMNSARLAIGIQGVTHAQVGFQKSLAYSKERLQMRASSGPKNPDGPADPIIVHPDVRRLLLSQKAIAEGGRMLNYYIAKLLDVIEYGDDAAQKTQANGQLGLLTPIAKAFLSEVGFEAANMGLQCFGGHGYVQEWGMEQNVRDARIACIYEGTTGIQALDLIGRKILADGAQNLQLFSQQIEQFCASNEQSGEVGSMLEELLKHNKEWGLLVADIARAAQENPEEVGAASVDFLMYSGYLVLAYFWAQAALVAQQTLDSGTTEQDFYKAKIKTAQFYFKRLLPRSRGYVATMLSGAESLMDLDAEHFSF